jgi:hypothetical protein
MQTDRRVLRARGGSMRFIAVALLGLGGCSLALPTETGIDGDRDGDGASALVDCDEFVPTVYPGAPEVCDGLDNDCDGDVPDDEAADWDNDGLLRCADCNDLDGDLGAVATFYRDADNDGYGSPDVVKYECDRPSGYVENADDCDDGDPFSFPDQKWYLDYDGDGYGNPEFFYMGCAPPAGTWVVTATDCDDTDPEEYPGQVWYPDLDGDGFGGDSGEVNQCERPGNGYIHVGGDCNDASATVFPDQLWAPDADGDGYGDTLLAEVSCGKPEDAKGAWVEETTDCDDTNERVNPGAEEYCDTWDTNCDGKLLAGELDEDGDGYGICNGDPDDTDPSVFPLLFTFYGVRTNFPDTDLVGWELCHSETYGVYGTSLTGTVLSRCNKNNLMLACRQTGSATITVAAHAPRPDVIYDTGSGYSSVHNANGVDWYYSSSYSWGFVNAGSGVARSSCDTMGSPDSEKRLCWHTSGGTLSGGYRCGTTTGLNSSSTWERLVYHAD